MGPMSPPRSSGTALRRHRAERRAARRTRRLAALALLAIVLVVTLLLTAFGSGKPAAGPGHPAGRRVDRAAGGPAEPGRRRDAGEPPAAPPDRAEPRDGDRLPRRRRGDAAALAGRPPGQRRLLRAPLPRRLRRPQGRAHLLPARRRRGRVDGRARRRRRAGNRRLLAGRRDDRRDHALRPERPPVRRADRHPADVGAVRRRRRSRTCGPTRRSSSAPAVVASGSRLGTVLDVSGVERQALARYTQDSGNHVAVQVKPAATLAVP